MNERKKYEGLESMLEEDARALRVENGDAFRITDETQDGVGHAVRFEATREGGNIARAFAETFRALPKLHDIKVLSDSIRAVRPLLKAFLTPVHESGSTPYRLTIVPELVTSFMLGVVLETYEHGIASTTTKEDQVALQRAFIDLGRRYARHEWAGAQNEVEGVAAPETVIDRAGTGTLVVTTKESGTTLEQGRAIAQAVRDAEAGRTKGDA